MKNSVRILIVAGIAVALVAAVVLARTGGGEVKQIEMQAVEARVITPTILASGSLTYQNEIRIMSEVMGRVKELLVKEGQQVQKGALLLRLDPATVQAQVDRLEAGLQQSKLSIERARVSADTAETKWKRYQQLHESGMIDANSADEVRSQRDQLKVEFDSAMAQSRQTEASLKEAREQLAKTELRAPITGRLTAVKIKIGETAVPSATSIAGSDLLVIADTTNLYAEVNVNETDVALVSAGQEARIVPAAFPDKAWKGVVDTVAVSPVQVQGQGKSYLVKIRLVGSDELQFHTGMSCRAEIATRGTNATPVVAVPVQAVQYEEAGERDQPAKASVFVVKDGRASRRPVTTGTADDAFIAIDKGLSAGERLAVGPARALRFLRDGDRVQALASTGETGEAVIELTDITKIYELGGTAFPALSAVNLSIPRNEFLALTGASGSGKSTMMNILGCLDTPSSGRYTLDGEEVAGLDEEQLASVRNRKVGFIFQNFYLMPRMTALDNVAQPLIYRGIGPVMRREHARRALERVGLGDRMRHRPNELSGGQKQRVAVARALVGQPELLLADEPTGNLDSRTAKEIMGLFGQLHAEGQTVVVVTHDPDIAAACRRIVRLHDGRVAEDHRND